MIHIILLMAQCFAYFWFIMETHGVWFKLGDTWTETAIPFSVTFAAVLSILGFLFVIQLCTLHTYLISVNKTTYEHLMHKFGWLNWSPFSKGSCLSNWRKMLQTRFESRMSYELLIKSSCPEVYYRMSKREELNLSEHQIA